MHQSGKRLDETLAAFTMPLSAAPAANLRPELQEAYRGTGLTLERVLLDIHAGRIPGETGVFLVDAAALLFLVLAISGLWLWARHVVNVRRRRRSRQPHPLS